MAINSDCDECGKTFPHSVSDYTRVCRECKKAKSFTVVFEERKPDVNASLIVSAMIVFDKEISLRRAREKCKQLDYSVIDVNHIEPRYGSERMG